LCSRSQPTYKVVLASLLPLLRKQAFAMSDYLTTEGEAPHNAAGEGIPCKTWYKVIGDLKNSAQVPLICLHGGPGAGHEYLASCIDLYEEYDIPLVFYDQIGCGRSTHFRDKMGDPLFWTFQLFIDELNNLVDYLGLRNGFSILGHSWGGMVGAVYAATHPIGLNKLILSSSPASIPLFVEAGKILRSQLPEDVCEILEKGEQDGSLDSPEYERASAIFYSTYVCRLDPRPEPIEQSFKNLKDDPTAYLTV
jgi:proline-specific peptidase